MLADATRSSNVPSPAPSPAPAAPTGATASSAVQRGQARDLIAQAADPNTGALDTRRLAGWVAEASVKDFDSAAQAHASIEKELIAQGRVGDLSRFNQDVVTATAELAPNGLWAAGQAMASQGKHLLVDNPILIKRWENTTSAWTGRSGFSSPLRELLTSHGIEFNATAHAAPPNSVGKSAGIPKEVANNTNGALARDAIADRWRAAGHDVSIEQPRNGGSRRVDVVADTRGGDPRNRTRVEIESKVGYTSKSSTIVEQVAKDAQALAENRTLRQTGVALERAGKVLRPVGAVMDAIEVGSAFHADGNRVGEKTGRAVAGVAGGALGGWGGAAAGAAIGTAILPVGGTVVGGLIGGAIGAFGGDQLAKGAFDTIKGWF